MQKIPTILTAEGMVLAKEIPLEGGRILCGKGTVLTETIIERLKRIDIPFVVVEGHPLELAGEKNLDDELKELEERFSRVKDIPPLMYLKKRITERLIAARGA